MRRLLLFNLALLVALAAFSVWAWPQLPERIPTHFDFRGEPDAWSERTIFSWFLLPGIGLLMTVLLSVTAQVAGRNPKYLNVPEKSRLLELPPEVLQPILGQVRQFVLVVNSLVLLLFWAIQWATYRTALGAQTRALLLVVLVAAVIVGPLLAVVITVSTGNAIREAHRRAQLQGTLRRHA